MKTNVSIKFNLIKDYREIESKLIELGYKSDEKWNKEFGLRMLKAKKFNHYYVLIYNGINFEIHNHKGDADYIKHYYNSLNDFLNDN